MKNIIIPITNEDSVYIERLYYEYNASLNIISFLMSRENTLDCHLQKYLDSSETKYTELELAKSNISKKYKPINFGEYKYSFNFDDNTLVYTVEDNE